MQMFLQALPVRAGCTQSAFPQQNCPKALKCRRQGIAEEERLHVHPRLRASALAKPLEAPEPARRSPQRAAPFPRHGQGVCP